MESGLVYHYLFQTSYDGSAYSTTFAFLSIDYMYNRIDFGKVMSLRVVGIKKYETRS